MARVERPNGRLGPVRPGACRDHHDELLDAWHVSHCHDARTILPCEERRRVCHLYGIQHPAPAAYGESKPVQIKRFRV
jgi:hypothetical protein